MSTSNIKIVRVALFVAFVVISASCQSGSKDDTPASAARFDYSQTAKYGDASLIIVGNYFQSGFARELVLIARALSPASRTVFLCTERFRDAAVPFLESNQVRNTEFVVLDARAPLIRQWARDIAIVGRRDGAYRVLVSPNKHYSAQIEAEQQAALTLQSFLPPPRYEIVVPPFSFEAGNIVFVERPNRRYLLTGRKTLFDNRLYQQRPWTRHLDDAGVRDLMREVFDVDSVIVMGAADEAPNPRVYFEYHLDMGMVMLRNNAAFVASLSFAETEKAELREAINARANVVLPFLALSSTPDSLVELLSDRLTTVAREYEIYATTLGNLDVGVQRMPLTWQHVVSSMSWTNVLQVGGRIIMPLYPEELLGNTDDVSFEGGYVSMAIDPEGVAKDEFELSGLNKENYDRYVALGYEVVTAPDYLHYFMGGIHCFVNILE